MTENTAQRPSASWQTCVTTIKCDAIDEYVSILVKGDWTSTCTWYQQFKAPVQGQRKGKPDKSIRKRVALCQGPQCVRVTQYRDQLIQEEQERSVPSNRLLSDPIASL